MSIQKIKNIKHFLIALAAVWINGFPARKMTVIAITGTDGKTTTVNLIYRLLKNAGIKTAMISTTGSEIDGREVFKSLHTTTPSPMIIQKLIKQAVTSGCTHLVLEVSSHAIDQNRIFGCNIKTAVLTNITHEHLDYHKTYDNYLKTKAKLLKKAKIRILNQDDISFDKVSEIVGKPIITYSINNNSNFKASNIQNTPSGMSFEVSLKKGNKLNISTLLIGNFNIENILAAIAAVKEEGVDDKFIIEGVRAFEGVPGRMELVNAGQSFRLIIDFALTPNAFEKVLPVVKQMTKGRVIHVFGSAGDRDQTKRPILGKIATQNDDLVVLTTDDTHSEGLDHIIPMLEKGLKVENWEKKEIRDNFNDKCYFVIPDRKEALEFALKQAREGDTVLLSGMGHQNTMNLNGVEVPWSDKDEAVKIIKNQLTGSET